MTTAAAETATLVASMTSVLGAIDAQRPSLVAQGRILPDQLGLIRAQAHADLQSRFAHPLSSFPPSLLQLFDAFVDGKLVEIERTVEIQTIVRQVKLGLIELASIDADLASASQSARIAALLPDWILRSLDAERLRANTETLFDIVRDDLRPTLELWYPKALPGIAQMSSLQALVTGVDLILSIVLVGQHRQRRWRKRCCGADARRSAWRDEGAPARDRDQGPQ